MLGDVLTAMVTPFRADGSIDLSRFRSLATELVESGSDGVVVAGTTGESPTLTDDERMELFAAAVDEVGDRATVVAGTGTYSTAHSVQLTERAHELGVDAFLVVTPYYNKPPQRAIVEHSRRSPPRATGPSSSTTSQPRRPQHRAGDDGAARGDPERQGRQAGERRPRPGPAHHELGLDLYAGDDNLILPFLGLGAIGGICVHTHVVGPR